jgi:Protein of unknown function (DUF2637)
MNSQLPAAAPAPRRNWVRRLANLLVALVVIAVAAATFVFSYDGVHAIALLGGVSDQLARYYPGLFDAVLVIACVAAVVLRDARWWARAWAWLVLVIVLAAIGLTDVLHAMNYTLRHRPIEGIVAAAPVVAVLLAFSLLLTLLRQSRSRGAGAAAGDEPGDWAVRRPTVPVPVDLPALPALPAAPTGADTPASANRAATAGPATVETQAVTAGSAIRSLASPMALPAGQETGPLTPPDGLPAMPGPATAPNEPLPPAAPPVASQRAPEGEPEPPTVSSPSLAPVLSPPTPTAQTPTVPVPTTPAPTAPISAAPVPTASVPTAPVPTAPVSAAPAPTAPVPTAPVPTATTAEPAPARSQGIRYAGSGAPARAAAEPGEPGEPEPMAQPGVVGAEHDAPPADYWDGDDAGQFAGLVYQDREENPGSEAGGPAARTEPVEIDEDAPPFATAPFAAVPRLNRVRSTPVPPEDDEDE